MVVCRKRPNQAGLVGGDKGNGTVYENGASLSNNSKGIDLGDDSKFVIDGPRLYNIVNHQSYTDGHLLEIDVKGKGFQDYTFITFGYITGIHLGSSE